MKQFFTVVSILVCLLLYKTDNAETQPSQETEPNSSITGFPVLGYSPETRFFGGAAVPYISRPSGATLENRPSTVVPLFIYTQEKQFAFEFSSDLYLNNEEYYVHTNFSYKRFPEKFFGIGYTAADKYEDLYTSKGPTLYIDILKRIHKGLYAGFKVQYADLNFDAFEEGGLLATGDYIGEKGGTVSGMGLQVNFDNRDNIIYPRSGKYVKLAAVFIDKSFGSDYNYNYFFVNGSKYISICKNNVLALNGFFKHMTGEVPFTKLASFHSDSPLRGYYRNYYRDMNGASLQAELRTQPFSRFGFVVFGGIGQVAHEISGFRMDRIKMSGGFGTRIKLIPKENLNLRIDYGYGEHSSGLYIDAGEVF